MGIEARVASIARNPSLLKPTPRADRGRGRHDGSIQFKVRAQNQASALRATRGVDSRDLCQELVDGRVVLLAGVGTVRVDGVAGVDVRGAGALVLVAREGRAARVLVADRDVDIGRLDGLALGHAAVEVAKARGQPLKLRATSGRAWGTYCELEGPVLKSGFDSGMMPVVPGATLVLTFEP